MSIKKLSSSWFLSTALLHSVNIFDSQSHGNWEWESVSGLRYNYISVNLTPPQGKHTQHSTSAHTSRYQPGLFATIIDATNKHRIWKEIEIKVLWNITRLEKVRLLAARTWVVTSVPATAQLFNAVCYTVAKVLQCYSATMLLLQCCSASVQWFVVRGVLS